MFLRDFVLIARIGKIHASLVQLLAWQRALREQLLAAVIDFLLGSELLLGSFLIELRLLQLLRQIRRSRSSVRGLSLVVSAFRVLLGGSKIAVFKHCQQLPRSNPASSIHQKLLYWRADLRHQCRL